MSWSLFSGLARDSSVAASIFAKASFVGANTVKGPHTKLKSHTSKRKAFRVVVDLIRF